MARHDSAIDLDPLLSRKRTADLLRQLRRVTTDARRLKSLIADLEQGDPGVRKTRAVTVRRRGI